MSFRIGPAGSPDRRGLPATTRWLARNGFRTCELDFGRRFEFTPGQIAAARQIATESDISYRAHAPLYAILAMEHDRPARVNSLVGSLHHSFKVIAALGGWGLTAHPGFLKGLSTEERVELCRANAERLHERLRDGGYDDMRLGLENMAHGPDFGGLDDIIAVCAGSGFTRPVIDWGHYQAHTDGCLRGPDDYRAALERINTELGRQVLEETTFQFSGIEYKDRRERRHLPYLRGDLKLEDLLTALTAMNLNDAIIVFESPLASDLDRFKRVVAEFEGPT
ncbi:MAG: TIM barrel protein [Dehalococcoidia bacterium]|nr:TIM barrel protein [Dehalococcoidia bacterium]